MQISPPPLPGSSPQERQWLTALHLSPLAFIIIPGFGHIMGPLILWLIKRSEIPTLDSDARAILNFQISWSIWFIAGTVLAFLGSCLVLPLSIPFLLGLAWFVIIIKAGLDSSNGKPAQLPLSIRFLG